MSYCVSPKCKSPHNPMDGKFCQGCGSQLLLKDRYRPIRPLSEGGFGKTFLAVDGHIPSQPSCVIKQLRFSDQDPYSFQKAVSLFRQEAVRLDELGQHPQIPNLLAHFEQEQQLYLVQEFIEGKTLSQELQQQGNYNEQQIWQLLQDLLPVLEYVHTHRVIHRDIKPANIIRRESNRQLVLIDFGVAKLFTDTELGRTGTIIGSVDYMSPEQLRGKTLPASDLYSLGVTCIYLLTQVPPFDMFDIVNNQWAWRDFLSPENHVSHRLGQILDKLLQNTISRRYQSADEVLRAMNGSGKLAFKRPSSVTQLVAQPVVQPAVSAPVAKVKVDLTKLQNFLVKKKWKEADQETWALLCLLLGKAPGSYLFCGDICGDIEKLPCEELDKIDQLWLRYSQGRFGFSVQKQIYQEVGEEYPNFCERIGWPTYNPHTPDTGLKFNEKAPLGHLPSRRWAGGMQWWRHAAAMAAKLEQCSNVSTATTLI